MARRDAQKMPKSEVLKGTLDLLVLQTLTLQRMHGYAIMQHIKGLTDDALTIEPGSLYPTLERLQKRGWVTAHWETSPTGRDARYYDITAAGRRQLGEEREQFDRAIWAIGRVLGRV
jgi:PadR family transcriptional regulator, regulatory protein PadR